MSDITISRWTSHAGNEYYQIEVDYSNYFAPTPHRMDRMGGTIEAPCGAIIEDVEVVSCESGWAMLLHELKDERNRDSFEEACIEELNAQGGDSEW